MTNIERFRELLMRYIVLLEALNNNYKKNQENNDNEKKRTYEENDPNLLRALKVIPGIKINNNTEVTFDVISGAGHKGGNVQQYIKGLDSYAPFGTIYMSVGVQGQGYINDKCNFLHWGLTHNNIFAKWNQDKDKDKDKDNIVSLKIQNTDISITKDDLYDNQNVENFYNAYCRLSTYLFLLQDRYNIVYTGAPGTGKTYLAKEMAAQLTCQKSYSLLSQTEKEHIGFVQFHPSYDYTDFVEGLRPLSGEKANQIGFKRQDGVFKKFCKKALEEWQNHYNNALYAILQNSKEYTISQNNNESKFDIITVADETSNKVKAAKCADENAKKYVFIIDEINRGELSKIFGELFYSIDPGYRGESGKVATQYQNLIKDEKDPYKDGFYVPKNVYIIGTMNEIDRSVEPMDFAVRRRFVWINVTPEERTDMWGDEAWKQNGWGPEARICMNNINKVIRSIETLGDNYCIGPAYFNNPPLTNANKLEKNDLWQIRIKSLIQEYLRVLPVTEANDYLKVIKAAYNSDKEISATEYEKK